MFDYIRDPNAIYDASFKAIDAAIDLSKISEDMRPIIARMVHSVAMPDIIKNIKWSDNAVINGMEAIANSANILCDAEMVKMGIIGRNLHYDNDVICTLNNHLVVDIAKNKQITRSAASVDLWRPYLNDGAIVVIGNAPTALFYLLERIIKDGWPKPSLILGFPVGFIGAAESKQALIDHAGDIPYITITGKLGGSAMAAASLNGLALNFEHNHSLMKNKQIMRA